MEPLRHLFKGLVFHSVCRVYVRKNTAGSNDLTVERILLFGPVHM